MRGKYRHRERILAKVNWRGDEHVLDVGTGRGLLLIGAAKRLTTGHATGIDIWNAEDLSGNGPDALKANIAMEGVGAKTTICSEDARQMRFAEDSFDVVVSNLCLHNIYEQPARRKALHEIVRVLKPGGLAVIWTISSWANMGRNLTKCGLRVEMGPINWAGTFPPLRILVAWKAEDLGARGPSMFLDCREQTPLQILHSAESDSLKLASALFAWADLRLAHHRQRTHRGAIVVIKNRIIGRIWRSR